MTKKRGKKCSSAGTVLANRAESPGSDIHHCMKWVWYTGQKSQHSGAWGSRNSRSSLANQWITGQPRLYESPSQKTKNKQAIVTYRKNINKAKTHCQQNRNYMLGSKGLGGKCYFFLEEVAFLPTNLCLLSLFQNRKRWQSCLRTPPPLCTCMRIHVIILLRSCAIALECKVHSWSPED